MAAKKAINLAIPVELSNAFDEVCRHYGHAKQKGMILSAAVLMFLRADPQEQGECLREVAASEIGSGVTSLLERAGDEQARRIAQRGSGQSASLGPAPRKAAKQAGESVRGRTKLPDLRKLRGRTKGEER